MEVIPDTIDDSEIVESPNNVTISRGFQVRDIDAKSRSDPFVLIRAATANGLPRWDAPHAYGGGAYRVRRRTFRPIGVNACRVRVDYVRQDFGTTRRVDWVFEEDTSTAGEQTQTDLQGDPIQVVYRPGGSAPDERRTLTLPVSTPLRVIVANGLLNQWPGDSWFDVYGSVNDRPWMGKPQAYWKQDGVRGVGQDGDANFQIVARFVTRIYRDWSDYGWYTSSLTGQIPRQVTDDKTARRAVLNAPYSNSPNNDANGFVKVGLYPLLNFKKTFGLDFKDRQLGAKTATNF